MMTYVGASLLRISAAAAAISPLRIHQVCRRSFSSSTFHFCARLPHQRPVPMAARRLSSASTVAARRASATPKTAADEKLRRVIDSEIDHAVDSGDYSAVEVPEDFPFEVIDKPGEHSIILKQKFGDETIEATVYMNPNDSDDYGEDDKDDEDEEDGEETFDAGNIQIIVKIEKGEGPYLEFCLNLNDAALEIENMTLKNQEDNDYAYEGPGFSVLDKALQDSLVKYLEVRGFKQSIYEFLHEYMLAKDEKEYIEWLKNMRDFVEK